MVKIIKIKINDRRAEKIVRKTLMNSGFVVIARKDFGYKIELELIDN